MRKLQIATNRFYPLSGNRRSTSLTTRLMPRSTIAICNFALRTFYTKNNPLNARFLCIAKSAACKNGHLYRICKSTMQRAVFNNRRSPFTRADEEKKSFRRRRALRWLWLQRANSTSKNRECNTIFGSANLKFVEHPTIETGGIGVKKALF